ncbi:MAG: hypothetical protein RL516_1242 [Bacteroidota bacterium]|jgi:hypothetical protein
MKKATLLFLIFSFITASFETVNAQRIIVKNQEKYDKQWIHFGFLLGTNKTNFKVSRAENLLQNDSVLFLSADGQTGFDLGIISNLRIAENFDLRFTPMLAFSQRNMNYNMTLKVAGSEVVTKKIESTFIQFPLLVKFKSNRVNNYRFYVLGGAKYMIDLVSQAKVETDEQLVKLKKYDYGYEIGFGMDLYLPLFKFAPEIKMYQGIPNILANDNAVYTTSLSGLKSRVWSISFTFE